MATQLNDITILVNDSQIAYDADSLSWKDGLGEYQMRSAVVGGGQTERIFSEDLSTKMGMVKFTMPSTPENESLKRAWKTNKDQNVIELVGSLGTGYAKVFQGAALLEYPETSAATDGSITLEFSSEPAV